MYTKVKNDNDVSCKYEFIKKIVEHYIQPSNYSCSFNYFKSTMFGLDC